MNKASLRHTINGATKAAESPSQPQPPKSVPTTGTSKPAAPGIVHKFTLKLSVKPQNAEKDAENIPQSAALGDDDVMSQERKPS